MEGEGRVMVLDFGSKTIKVGWGGQAEPTNCFEAVKGFSKMRGVMVGLGRDYVGEEALAKRRILDLTYPIQKGVVTDWDKAEWLLSHALRNELEAIPCDHTLLMTEKLWNTEECREQTVERAFETIDVKGFSFVNDAASAVLASGKQTGLALNVGHQVTSATAVHEGRPMVKSLAKADYGGEDMLSHFVHLSKDHKPTIDSYILQECMVPSPLVRGLFSNIVLDGGVCSMPGLKERLERDLKLKAPPTDIHVHSDGKKNHAAWKGASILASLSTFADNVITAKEYQECGIAILNKKCAA